MAEETSIWKSVRRQGGEHKFIEFDYLVVLDNQDNVVDIRKGKWLLILSQVVVLLRRRYCGKV